MTRYQVGDKIKVLPDVPTAFAGLEGVIQEIQPHQRGITTLDRYTVLFSWGERQIFYEVQLTSSGKRSKQDPDRLTDHL